MKIKRLLQVSQGKFSSPESCSKFFLILRTLLCWSTWLIVSTRKILKRQLQSALSSKTVFFPFCFFRCCPKPKIFLAPILQLRHFKMRFSSEGSSCGWVLCFGCFRPTKQRKSKGGQNHFYTPNKTTNTTSYQICFGLFSSSNILKHLK